MKSVLPAALEINALGQLCPMPLLMMRRGLRQIEIGERLSVKVSDSASVRDFQSFIDLTDHQLLSYSCAAGVHTYIIERGA